MINDASVVIGGGNWGIKEADVLGYKLINNEYYARDIDFANSTAAGTYTDSTGVIRKAPYNLLQRSEEFDNGAWGKLGGSTVTANQATAPNGTLTADLITEGTSVLVYFPTGLNTFRAGTYTQSYYAKKGTGDIFGMYFGSGFTARFNLTSGTIVSTSNATATIQSVGDGWYRCTATATLTTDFYAGISYSNSSGLTVFAWGAQLVEGTEALPYFPTTTRLNVPRIDYRNADGSLSTVGRLLLEPQRTNLALYSEQFDNAAWAKIDTTITANTTISPDGYQNADTMTTSVGTSRVIGNILTGAGTFTISCYVKRLTGDDNFQFRLVVDGSNQSQSFDVTNEWQRFTFTVTAASSVTSPQLRSGSTGTGTFAIWGAQFEVGAYATTYIPTTTATVTRNADSASRTGVSSWIGQAEGTLFFECNLKTFSSISALFALSDGTSTNRLRARRTAAQTIALERNLSGQADQSVAFTTVPTSGTIKAAFAWSTAANGMAIYINGTGTSLASAIPMFSGQLSVLSLGMLQDATSQLGDGIGQFYLLPTRITNEQLSQLTTL